MSVGGIDAIPKCAHGSPECVFSVQVTSDGAHPMTLRARLIPTLHIRDAVFPMHVVILFQICDDGKLMGDGFGRNRSNICLTVPRSSKVVCPPYWFMDDVGSAC